MIIVLALIATLYVSTLGMLWLHQEKFIFKPSPDYTPNLDIWGYKNHHLQLEWNGEQAHANLFTPLDSPLAQAELSTEERRELQHRETCLIFFYGNADSITASIERLRWFAKVFNSSIFVAEYPGFGQTAGPVGQSETATLMNHWNKTLQQDWGFRAEQRLIWGHSLGGAVASQFAARHGGHGLILENTFNNMIDMAGEIYPFMPIRWVCRHPFESDAALKNWSGPILQFHSPTDNVVPYDIGKKLFDSLDQNHKKVWVPLRSDHNRAYQQDPQTLIDNVRALFPTWVRP